MTLIHSNEEMDALPVGTVVLDNIHNDTGYRAAWYRRHQTGTPGYDWRSDLSARAVLFPALIVHRIEP